MGDVHRHRSVTQAGWNVVKCPHSACFFLWREKNVSPDSCAAGVVTQRTDVLALVMPYCVQLVLERGATSLSSLNAPK